MSWRHGSSNLARSAFDLLPILSAFTRSTAPRPGTLAFSLHPLPFSALAPMRSDSRVSHRLLTATKFTSSGSLAAPSVEVRPTRSTAQLNYTSQKTYMSRDDASPPLHRPAQPCRSA